MTGYDFISYSYNLDSERMAKTIGGTAISYVLDASGRRIGKKVNGTLEQGFLYGESASFGAGIRPLAELDGANAVVKRFVYASDGVIPSYMLRLEGSPAAWVKYRIISDHLGSPLMVVKALTGEVLQQITYDAFGNVLTNSAPGFQPFGFAGGLLDSHTGLVHISAREYDPFCGRFLTKDPILFEGGLNLYGYCMNDPINWVDPLGYGPDGDSRSWWRKLWDGHYFGTGYGESAQDYYSDLVNFGNLVAERPRLDRRNICFTLDKRHL